jgi:hypothetical protein
MDAKQTILIDPFPRGSQKVATLSNFACQGALPQLGHSRPINRLCLPVDVRFSPKATEVLLCSGMALVGCPDRRFLSSRNSAVRSGPDDSTANVNLFTSVCRKTG